MAEPEKLNPMHGGYRKLKSFPLAQLAHDMTVRFCDHYIWKRSRTLSALMPRLLSGKWRVPAAAKLLDVNP